MHERPEEETEERGRGKHLSLGHTATGSRPLCFCFLRDTCYFILIILFFADHSSSKFNGSSPQLRVPKSGYTQFPRG